MSFEKILADRVRLLRVRADMEQREVAEKVGITQTALSNYETGIRKIPAALVPKFAEVFGVSTDFLYGIVDDTVDRRGYIIDPKS